MLTNAYSVLFHSMRLRGGERRFRFHLQFNEDAGQLSGFSQSLITQLEDLLDPHEDFRIVDRPCRVGLIEWLWKIRFYFNFRKVSNVEAPN